jgi:hypothetical protein
MFDSLSSKLDKAFQLLKGHGRITGQFQAINSILDFLELDHFLQKAQRK